jgi:DNA-binding HxlR family transcriptional regulator/putative sterol carrier protein
MTFRYEQFCPLARAAEVLGERWTLLVVRELLIGPQRFSDLRRRLPGVSSSVLSSRLRALEERGVVARRALPPPAASTIVELTDLGRALRPVVVALAAWGIRLMEPRRPGDHFEPSWLRLGLMTLIGPQPTPARAFVLRMPDGDGETLIHVSGGPQGTRLHDAATGPAPPDRIDATVRADAQLLLQIATGATDPVAALEAGELALSGDRAALRDLPALFSVEAALAGRSTVNAAAPDNPTSPLEGAGQEAPT